MSRRRNPRSGATGGSTTRAKKHCWTSQQWHTGVSNSLGSSLYRRQQHRRQLRLEPLEERRLLSITVTTLEDSIDFDDGVTSLREAIFAANIVPGADTIEFAPSLTASGPATILLTQGELKITDSLTISGPGANLLTIDAIGNDLTPEIDDGLGSRVFDIDDGRPDEWIDASILGLTISNGDSDAEGGGIRTTENLSLIDTVISNNSSFGAGGGLFVSGSGFFDRASAKVVGSELSGNRSVASVIGTGGGVYGYFANISVANSRIRENFALSGGGLSIRSGALAITSSVISGNTARESGGAVRVYHSSTTIESSAITGNSAKLGNGGGVTTGTASLKLVGCAITGNSAARYGGGVADVASGVTEIIDCTISGNSAGVSGGGALLFTSTAIIDGSTISGNSAVRNGGGVALYTYTSQAKILRSTITGNTCDLDEDGRGSGGGIYEYFQRQVLVESSIIAGNVTALGIPTDIGSAGATHFSVFSSLVGTQSGTLLVEAPLGSADANGNLIGGPVHGVIDPQLGPLADNGGFELPDGSRIRTHALLPGSPAINAGDLSALAGQGGVPEFDQRGEPFGRIIGGRIDIGAFEYQTPTAINFLVDTLEDESDGDYSRGDLSLREAIELANAARYAGVVDTIHFDPALTANGPATILLTQGEIAITDSLTINGPGAGLLSIDASGTDPTPDVNNGDGSGMFYVDDGDIEARIDVSISGVTLSGVDTGGGLRGVGVIRSQENIALSEVVVRDNYIVGEGALVVEQANLTILACRMIANVTGSERGLASVRWGELSISDTQIVENRFGRSLVEINDGRASLARTVIDDNSSTPSSNAVLRATRAGLSVEGGSIDNNQNAFGIVIADGNDLRIRDTSISQNGGRGIFAEFVSADEIEIRGCTISGNSGSGIDMRYVDGAVVIANCTIADNNQRMFGRAGGLNIEMLSGSVDVYDTVVEGNTGPAFSLAGAFWSTAGARILMNVEGGRARIERSNFIDNVVGDGSTSNNAGGLCVRAEEVDISDCVFAGNTAVVAGGLLVQGHEATIVRSQVTGNKARYTGGGIVGGSERMTIVDSFIADNSAVQGGGIETYFTTLVVRSTITGNSTIASTLWIFQGDGAGIYHYGSDNTNLSLVDSVVERNSAYGAGGGIWSHGNLDVIRSTISHNTAGTGGGIWLRGGTISDSTISSNTSLIGGGIHATNATIHRSTLTLNRATILGGGAFIDGGELSLDHTIVAQNLGSNPDFAGLLGSTISAAYSLIGNNSGSGLAPAPVGLPDANGNLIGGSAVGTSIDAKLAPLADNGGFELPDGSTILTHALLPGSPAINAGDLNVVAGEGGVPEFDQRGEPFTRVYGGRIDIGAVELIPEGILPGDYWVDGAVDARDYTLWRDSLGAVLPPGTGADGNGDGVVDDLDHAVWKSNFGKTAYEQGARDGESLTGSSAQRSFGTRQEVIANANVAAELPPAEPGAGALSRRLAPPQDNAIQPPALPGVGGLAAEGARPSFSVPRDRALETWFATRRGMRPRESATGVAVVNDRPELETATIDAALAGINADSMSNAQSAARPRLCRGALRGLMSATARWRSRSARG